MPLRHVDPNRPTTSVYELAERYYGGFSDYKAKTAHVGRRIPVFRLTPIGG